MKKVLLTALVLTLAFSVSALAERGKRGKGDCGRHPMGMMGKGMHAGAPGLHRILMLADELKLTDNQKQQLEKMMTDFQLEQIDLRSQLEKERVRLHGIMRDDKAPEADVMAGIDRVSQMQANMKKMHYRHLKAAKSVLTTDQINQLKEMRGEFRGRGFGPGFDDDDDDDDEEDGGSGPHPRHGMGFNG